jgi:SPP1 family phage portal protein
MKDSTKPNNKIANPYARYITDTLVGYFVGKPITYNSADTKIMEELSMIFEYNDEADENSELAKSASMYGVAYERLYVDEDGMIRFKKLDSRQCFPIFDRSIDSNLLYFIRYFEDYDIVTETTYYVIELLTRNSVITYRANETLSTITAVDEVPHYFKMVPIAIYENNEEEIGDYEEVISLIDAYDKMESDTLNDFEYFVDAYLALYGFTADPEDVQAMKENRVLLMDEGTSAEWLTKDTSDTHIENQKIRLDKDIHKYSFCPDMSD